MSVFNVKLEGYGLVKPEYSKRLNLVFQTHLSTFVNAYGALGRKSLNETHDNALLVFARDSAKSLIGLKSAEPSEEITITTKFNSKALLDGRELVIKTVNSSFEAGKASFNTSWELSEV